MTARDEDDPHTSDQLPDGDLGVSSEREGPTGPGQVGTTGTRDTVPVPPEDGPPEQSTGGAEENPQGLPPKAAPPRNGA